MASPANQAEQFAYAVNSANGHQGKISAVCDGTKVTLTQVVSGDAGNTEIVYTDMLSPDRNNYYWHPPTETSYYSFYGDTAANKENYDYRRDYRWSHDYDQYIYVYAPIYGNALGTVFTTSSANSVGWSYDEGGSTGAVVNYYKHGYLDPDTVDADRLSDYVIHHSESSSSSGELFRPVSEFGRGQWTTTVGEGFLNILKSTPSGFTGGISPEEDGSPDYIPAGADYTGFKWQERASGDDETNPLPSFVSKKINDISFFKNRLVVLAGENSIMSEVGGYFNFFRNTVTSLLDTEVIDVGVGGTEVNELFQAVPFSDRLILFSTRTQFALQGETILSPATASISQVTNFDVDTNVDPFTVGPSLFFAFNRGTYSGLREFYRTGDSDIQFDAVESSAQVPRYVKGPIKKISASSHEDIVVVMGSETDTMYVYKYFKSAEGSLQSAWCKFVFNNAELVDMRFIKQALYIVLVRDGKTYLEKMNLQTGLLDAGKDFVTHLDRRTEVTTSDSPGFTITLPSDYLIADGDTMQVVDDDGELMTVDSYTVGTNTITLKEEMDSYKKYYIGIPYTMRYEISKPVLKRPKQGGGWEIIAVGRHQIRYVTVVYDDTACFVVRVTPEIGGSDGTPIEYDFSGNFLSAGNLLGSRPNETGDFRFPVFAESDSVKIEILNDTPLPSSLQAVTFEASYSSRSTASNL
tara:strand:- start:123 stop:2201 length:2079 start_codon:yes stop_codon:yes gene_type:complete